MGNSSDNFTVLEEEEPATYCVFVRNSIRRPEWKPAQSTACLVQSWLVGLTAGPVSLVASVNMYWWSVTRQVMWPSLWPWCSVLRNTFSHNASAAYSGWYSVMPWSRWTVEWRLAPRLTEVWVTSWPTEGVATAKGLGSGQSFQEGSSSSQRGEGAECQ